MKKGLLTLLAASLVFVGCQNYDDQFDDLNAQISALKSQVDGLASLSGQVSSLSGTISGLQAGVTAAQSAAQSASAAASAIDLTGLSASLATLQAEVDAVQASLATAATASAVAALQTEIDALETDLDDLLSSSNIYSTDVSVTNATTLNSALALGNKLNVLNATLTITGYSGMDYTKVQTLMDRVNTMTGNLVYSAYSSTGTEVVFNNLVSAGDITVTQPGGYSFPKLVTAGTIDMKDDFETTVTNISFPALTTADAIKTDATGSFEVIFTYATNVDFGAMVTAPSNTVTITTKTGATLDLGAWKSQDASGNATTATVTLTGPASFTNGTAAGTFASTGLPGNTVGAHDGTISLTNVATAAIHNFRGTVTLGTGVKNFTGNNIVAFGHSSATDLETVNVTFIRDNDPGLSSGAVADLGEENKNTAQDVSFGLTHTKLTSLTLTGKGGDVVVNAAPALTTVDLEGLDAFDVTVHNNVALTSFTDAKTANDWTADNNDLMTSYNASHTTTMTTGSGSTDAAASFSVVGNAEITSLTIASDDIDDLDITGNAKLATLSASSLKDNGSSTAGTVDIYDNAFVADLVKDSMESSATRALSTWAVGGSLDTGSITTSSGLPTLDAYLTDVAATSSAQSVWFDTVTKLEIQSVYGGAYTDTTSSLPTSAPARTGAKATDFSSTYSGYLAYFFVIDAVSAVTRTDGAISKEKKSYAFDVVRDATTLAETTTLGTSEGFEVFQTDVLLASFKDGAAYSGAANGSTVETLADLVNFINADTALNTGYDLDLDAARDGFNKAVYDISYTYSTGATATAGAVSNSGLLNFTFGNYRSGASMDLQADVSDGDGASELAATIITRINATGEYTAAATGGNGNVFYVTKHVSASGLDRSPDITLSSFPTLTFVTDSDSTTASLVKEGRGSVSLGSGVAYNYDTATASEANGSGSGSEFVISNTKSLLSGIRLTLTNNRGTAFATNTGVTVGAVSNTSIVAASTATDSSITQGLIVAGTNIASYEARTGTAGDNYYNEGTANYVAAFSEISSGTATTTTAAVTGYTTNRSGW